MNSVNRDNYEIYILDYVEGNLSPAKAAAFRDFLNQNPDIKQQVSFLKESPALNSPATSFAKKNTLKRDVNTGTLTPSNAEAFIIADMEGDLDDEARRKLLKLAETDAGVAKTMALYQKTRLTPGNEIYSNKGKLKHKVSKSRRLYASLAWASSVAAAILILFLLLPFSDKAPQIGIADNTDNPVPAQEKIAEPDKNPVAKDAPETPLEQSRKPYENPDAAKVPVPQNPDENMPVTPEETENDDVAAPVKMPVIRINNIEIAQVSKIHRNYSPAPEIPSIDIYQKADAVSRRQYERSQGLLGSLYNNLNITEPSLPSVDVWDIAQAGVKGFNALTENNMELDRKVNEQGRVVALAIKGENINFQAPLRLRE